MRHPSSSDVRTALGMLSLKRTRLVLWTRLSTMGPSVTQHSSYAYLHLDLQSPRASSSDVNPFPSISACLRASLGWPHSESGWNRKHVFLEWIHNVFIPNAKSRMASQDDHGLLIIDGASPHICAEALQELMDANIHVIALPAHSSHFMQPCDQYVFANVKKALETGPFPTNLHESVALAMSAIQIGTQYRTVIASWRASGLWPICEDHLMHNEFVEHQTIARVIRRKRVVVSGQVLTTSGMISQIRSTGMRPRPALNPHNQDVCDHFHDAPLNSVTCTDFFPTL